MTLLVVLAGHTTEACIKDSNKSVLGALHINGQFRGVALFQFSTQRLASFLEAHLFLILSGVLQEIESLLVKLLAARDHVAAGEEAEAIRLSSTQLNEPLDENSNVQYFLNFLGSFTHRKRGVAFRPNPKPMSCATENTALSDILNLGGIQRLEPKWLRDATS